MEQKNTKSIIDCDTGYNLFVTRAGIGGEIDALPIKDRVAKLDEIFNYAKKIHNQLKQLERIQGDESRKLNLEITSQNLFDGIYNLMNYSVSYIGGLALQVVMNARLQFDSDEVYELMDKGVVNKRGCQRIINHMERILSATIYVLRHLWSIDTELPWCDDLQEYANQYGIEKTEEIELMITNLYQKYQSKEMYPYFNNYPSTIHSIISSIENAIENNLLEEDKGIDILNEIIRIAAYSYEISDLYMNKEMLLRWESMINEGEGAELRESLYKIQ